MVRFVRFRVFLVTAAIFGCPLLRGHAAEERELTGREADAIALAVTTFHAELRKDPKSNSDLKHYTVLLQRHGAQVDVAFVPDRSPRPKNIPKDQEYLDLSRCTVYGCEIHYIIRLDRMKIIDVHY